MGRESIYEGRNSIIICIISSIFVVLKMYTGNNIFLLIFLLLTSAGILFDRIEYKFEYLLFFISWVYVLKFKYSDFSLFIFLSAIYIFICIIYMLIHNSKLEIKFLLSYMLFAAYVITIPLVGGSSLTTVLGFLLNYTLLFFAVSFVKNNRLFGRYIRMYALGLLLSSFIRLISYKIPDLNQYFISMTEIYTLIVGGKLNIRFAGADIDPNYYSIQILLAISCLLVSIYYDKERKNISVLLCMMLSVLGFLSLSKMYLIVFLFLVILALISFSRNNIKVGIKFTLSILLCGGVVAFFAFDYLYSSYFQRFVGSGQGFAGLTTGRSEIWQMFLSDITIDMRVLILGVGYGAVSLNDTMAHNSYLTGLYYMGIIGTIITLIYFNTIRENLIIESKNKKRFKILSVNNIPLLTLLLANFSLDSFVMEYFPIHLFLVIFALNYNGYTKHQMI